MIVKIQIPIVTNESPPEALVYNRDRSFQTTIPVADVEYMFGPRELKIYCLARLDGQKLTLGRKLLSLDW